MFSTIRQYNVLQVACALALLQHEQDLNPWSLMF
jgi:hypothetical protein